MAFDPTALPPAHVRRSDRAVEDVAWIQNFLQRAPVGVLATASDGQPFINSNLFVYDQAAHAIYLHTARTGRTRSNVEAQRAASASTSSRWAGCCPPTPRSNSASSTAE